MGHSHNKHHEHNHGIGCTCHECHEGENKVKIVIQLIVSTLIFVLGILYENFATFSIISSEIDLLIIFLISYLIVGFEVIINAFKRIFKGEFFDETFLMTLASICAFIVGEYSEGCIVMILYQLGELLQDIAVDNSHKSIENLLDLKEVVVHKIHEDDILDEEVTNVKIDDIILVKPGERIPLDGIIIEGNTSLNMSSLTGESLPVDKQVNDEVLSGSINLQSLIKIKVTSIYDDSTVSKILKCIEDATVSKTENEKFITKFSKIYTPIVVIAAILLVIIPPLLFKQEWNEWIYRAATFLVVSCPCALVISVPLAYFVGIGVSSTKGILMKGSNYLEILDKMNVYLFDKTGTLTSGKMHVEEVNAIKSEKKLIETISIAEAYSNHPISSLFNKNLASKHKIEDYKEVFGKGIELKIDGKEAKVGKLDFVTDKHIDVSNKTGSLIFASLDNEYLGYLVIKDTIKEEAKDAIHSLKTNGIRTVMVSGDSFANSVELATKLEMDNVYSDLLPDQKASVVDSYTKEGNKVVFIGDGVNDAPSLVKSDIGIAMGGVGSNAAIEASDIVVMNDSLNSLINAKEISKATVRIVKENIIAICLVKLVALVFGAFGELPIWLAVLSDTGICLLTILNSLRLFLFAGRKVR